MTAFGNKAITYNANGEIISFDGWDYTWSKGKLSSISKTLTSSSSTWALKPGLPSLDPIRTKTYSFAYNAFGQRTGMDYSYTSTSTSAISIGEVTDYSKKFYYDHAGRLMLESVTKTYYNDGTASYTIAYLYDESAMIGMEYQTATSSVLYYFQRNLQGDVIGIYDKDGNLKARYIYDAWGNCTIASGSDMELAKANPIRYRGYYYDTDIGLYYLNARYYNPAWRRFISPDSPDYLTPEKVNGLCLYSYCNNDPVNNIDPTGHFVITILALIAVAVAAFAATIHDIIQIAKPKENGGVGIEYNEKEGTVRVVNSAKVFTPWMCWLYSFYLNSIYNKTRNILKGNTNGIAYEWMLHNLAAWVGIGEEGQASNVDLGTSIFSDAKDHPIWTDEGLQMNGLMSAFMIITYMIFMPRQAWIWDLIVSGGF